MQIRLSVTLDHALCLAIGEQSLIEQTLSQSIEQAQLWSQLDLKAYVIAAGWSFSSHTSNLTLDLSASSSYTEFDDSKNNHDASGVQPPAIIPVNRFNTICIFMKISKRSTGIASNTMYDLNTTLQFLPETSNHTQMCRGRINSISESRTPECSDLIRAGSIMRRTGKKSQTDYKTVISLIDVCFRKVLCSNSRIPRGINLIQDSRLMSLADFAPSSFIPEHGRQLSQCVHLIQPMARFLSEYSSRVSSLRNFQNSIQTSESHLNSDDAEIDPETSLTRESCAASLWVLMSKSLAAKLSNSGLKPLVFDKDHGEARIVVPDPQHEILDERNIDDDDQSICSLASDPGDISLFEVYSAQVTAEEPRAEQDHSGANLHRSNGDSEKSGEGTTNLIKSFEQTRSMYNLSQAHNRRLMPEGDVESLRSRECDYEMLNETTFLLDECSRALPERRYEAMEKESPSEAIAEPATTSPTSLFSLIMDDDDDTSDADRLCTITGMDSQLQEMLDMQEASLEDDYESMTDILLEFSPPTMRCDRLSPSSASDFVAEDMLSHADVLQANLGHYSPSASANTPGKSMVVRGNEENTKQASHRATDMEILNWELDLDQDMIHEHNQGHGEYDKADNRLMNFEYESTLI